jgi:hypothetical protein
MHTGSGSMCVSPLDFCQYTNYVVTLYKRHSSLLQSVIIPSLQVGFPAVIKPIAFAASMGVVRVDSLDMLKAKVWDGLGQSKSLNADVLPIKKSH